MRKQEPIDDPVFFLVDNRKHQVLHAFAMPAEEAARSNENELKGTPARWVDAEELKSLQRRGLIL